MKNILVKKATVIFGLIIILMIALSMTSDVISERSRFKQTAKHNIAKSWTGEQKLIGPVLVVPYYVEQLKTVWNKALKKDVVETSVVLRKHYMIPDQLSIEGIAKTQMRYRGMYAVPVYSSSLEVTGHFSNQDLLDKINKENKVVSWGLPYISVYINDSRGIPLRPNLHWQDQLIPFISGTRLKRIEQGDACRFTKPGNRDEKGVFIFFFYRVERNGKIVICPHGHEYGGKINI